MKLEGLINGVVWAIQNHRIPLIVKGDSQEVINIARRLMNGASISQVSRNRRWECRLIVLRIWLRDTPTLLFSHVK